MNKNIVTLAKTWSTILVLLSFSCKPRTSPESSASIFDRQLVSPDEKIEVPLVPRKAIEPILFLFGPKINCSSVYLGQGFILTAQHCFDGHLENPPPLQITNYTWKWVIKLTPAQYKIHLPPVLKKEEITVNGKKTSIPQPDLVLVQITDTTKTEKLKNISAAKISANPTLDKEIFIAGYGHESRSDNDWDYLGVGKAKIDSKTDLAYSLIWKSGEGYAGAGHGDSGGPLFTVASDGALELLGIASNVEISATSSTSKYVCLHQENTICWLGEFGNVNYCK